MGVAKEFLEEFEWIASSCNGVIDKIHHWGPYICDTIIKYIICLLVLEVILAVVSFAIWLLGECITFILSFLEKIVFGGTHNKSYKYNAMQIWALKFSVDINYFRNSLLKLFPNAIHWYFIFKELIENWKNWRTRRWISLDGIFTGIRALLCYLFGITIKNILILFLVISIYFRERIIENINFSFLNNITIINISVSITAFVSVVALVYFFTGLRLKSKSYSEIKNERTKKIIEIEETLLLYYQDLYIAINENIEKMIANKFCIISKMLRDVGGGKFWINKSVIVETDERYMKILPTRDFQPCQAIEEFADISNIINKINETIKEGGVDNIKIIDNKTIDNNSILNNLSLMIKLNSRHHMDLLCKTSISEWYEMYVKRFQNKAEEMTIRKLKEEIDFASLVLDLALEDAMMYEIELRNTIRKLNRKYQKINSVSKYCIQIGK